MTEPTPGLRVTITRAEERILLAGSFALDAEADPDRSWLAALVMVVAHRGGYAISRPFMDRVPFTDDVSSSSAGIEGSFEIDFEEHRVEGIRRYDVLLSIQEHLSPVLEIELPG